MHKDHAGLKFLWKLQLISIGFGLALKLAGETISPEIWRWWISSFCDFHKLVLLFAEKMKNLN